MEYSKLIFLVIGAVIGFVLSILKDYLLENKKNKLKEKEFKRQKLEEVFILMDKISKRATSIEYDSQDNDDNVRLAMLIRFYFDDINDDYQSFRKEYAKLNFPSSEIPQINIDDFMKEYSKVIEKIVIESKKL